jgi:hypothetical protein
MRKFYFFSIAWVAELLIILIPCEILKNVGNSSVAEFLFLQRLFWYPVYLIKKLIDTFWRDLWIAETPDV